MTDILQVAAGKIITMTIDGSAGCTELDIQDNSEGLRFAPSLFGSVDNGETFAPMSAELMRQLQSSTNNLMLRIDCSQMPSDIVYIIYDIVIDGTNIENAEDISAQEDEQHYHYDASQRALDEADLKKVVNDNITELSKAAQDNAGWDVMYYRAESIKNISVLSAWELRSITDVQHVQVFFPHRKTIGNLDFDQFGLSYEELTTLHILADEFHRVYKDSYARPRKLDIIYIPFLDQYFEISEVSDVKTPTNLVNYYELTMRFISDRSNVAKDADILDVSDMIDSLDKDAIRDYKDNLRETDATYPVAKPTKQAFDKRTWSHQVFELAQLQTIDKLDNAHYGIANVDGVWNKVKVIDSILYIAELNSAEYDMTDVSVDDKLELYFAKYAMFDKALSTFDENMYFSTPTISRTLQPLQLIELQDKA